LLLAGTTVTYYFTVQAPALFEGLDITGDKLSAIACGFAAKRITLPAKVSANNSLICSATHTVTQDEIEAGNFTHQVNFTASTPPAFKQTHDLAPVKTSAWPSMSVSVVTTGCTAPDMARK
jgi:hypothetical protein